MAADDRFCGTFNHHGPHEWKDAYSMDWQCAGLQPATDMAEAVRRLNSWALVESLPAQDEFDDILDDLRRLASV